MFRTILFQKLRIKISSTHLDVRFSRVEGEMGCGNGATGNFRGKVRAEEVAGGVWIWRAGLPKTFPNMTFILSFRIWYRIWQDHRQLLAESTKWIIGPQEGTVVEAKWELWRGTEFGAFLKQVQGSFWSTMHLFSMLQNSALLSNHDSISDSTQPSVDSVSPPLLVLDYNARSRMLEALSKVCYRMSDRATYKHLCRKSPVVTYLTKWRKHSLARRLRKWDLSVNFLVNWMLSKKIFYWSPQVLILSELCYTVLVNTLT